LGWGYQPERVSGWDLFVDLYFDGFSSVLIKIQPDATVCRYLFTAKSLYMFQGVTAPVSHQPRN